MMKNYLSGALALGLLFTGCTSDDIQGPEGNKVSDVDQTFYVNMRISGDVPSSRASNENGTPEDTETDFSEGTENAINNAYFVFYDAAGNVVGEIVPVELGNDQLQSTVSGATVEKYYKSVVPVSVRKGENLPAQVICYINPISPSTLQNPLAVIQTVARNSVSSTVNINGVDTECFAMSNSVYYPAGEADSSTPVIATPIPENLLYKTEKEAEDAVDSGEEAKAVNIYVERYATKLQFSAEEPTAYQTVTRVYAANGTYTVTPVTLTFSPQYWALNAESKTSYVIKSFRQESEQGQIMADNYQYGSLNGRINPAINAAENELNYGAVLGATNAWDWNNPDFRRSYWSVSPAYFTAAYPEVSSDVTDSELNQKYLTYNELATLGFAADVNTPKYFKETTTGTKALASENPAAAMPSVIYVGKYNISVNGGTSVSNQGFYTYLTGDVTIDGNVESRPYVYFTNPTDATTGANTSINSSVAGGESMLKRFLAQTTILFKADAENPDTDPLKNTYTRYTISNDNDITKLLGYLSVSEISDAVKKAAGDQAKTMKLQANARSLQFTSVPSSTANIWIATGNGYRQIVADNAENFDSNTQVKLSVANATLMQQVGYAYYYHLGEGYFNIPVKHLGWYRAGNTQKNADKINWKIVRVGDFGMVRNHSYNIKVNQILGLASGIGGNDVPIVPPATTDDYFVAYSVRILKWAVVPQQGVNL